MNRLAAGTKRRIRRQLSGEKPTVWIGKNRFSHEVLKEIERHLEKKEMVKIKILKSAIEGGEAKEAASRIAMQTDSSLVDVRGHTFILYKRRKK